VYIEGQIRYEEWTDKDGNKRNTTRIRVSGPNSRLVMLGGRGDGGGRSSGPSDGPPPDDDGGFQATDDDVPF
jgi:single-strand DNA-binding protein